MAVLTHVDSFVPEQVIAVPKITCLSRSARTVLSEPQVAEQLLEVPTPVSHVNVIFQTADIPVGAGGIVGTGGHRGFFRGQSSSTSAEQTTDIPVPGRLRGGLQGFSPGQSSTQRIVEQNVGLPVPCPRRSRGFPPRQGSQRTVEQIIGFPVSRTRDGGGLPGVHLQWSSTARGGARDAWLRRVLRSLRRGCMPSLMRSRPTISSSLLSSCSVYRDPSGARTATGRGTWYAGFAVVQFALCLRCSHHGRFGPEGKLRGEMSRFSSFLAVTCTKLVLLVRYAVPFSGCRPRCSASCRYVLERLRGRCTSCCFLFFVLRPMMLSIMVGMTRGIFAATHGRALVDYSGMLGWFCW